MGTRRGASPEFWIVCGGPEDDRGPLVLDCRDRGEAVAVFSFEEEALLYLRLDGRDGDLSPARVSCAGLQELLSGRWSGFGSVALDPVPGLDFGALLPLVATSRERFARFLSDRGGETVVAAS